MHMEERISDEVRMENEDGERGWRTRNNAHYTQTQTTHAHTHTHARTTHAHNTHSGEPSQTCVTKSNTATALINL